jgi:four helix bundle protein
MVIQKCTDIEVYNMSFESAMNIFELTRQFPREELFSMVDQARRSSRSVTVNIREGYAKRKYPDVFVRHLNDALGSSEETLAWLDFADRCRYLSEPQYHQLSGTYQTIGAKIFTLMRNWQKF